MSTPGACPRARKRAVSSRRPALSALLAALAGALAMSAHALAQAGPQLSISQLDTSDLPKLSAVAVVTDADGRPAQGLDATAFTATVGGQPVQVVSAEPQVDLDQGLGVVIAIDTSGSMAEGDAIGQAKAAARAFVNGLAENDQAALVSFATAVTDGEFTSDELVLGRSIDRLAAEGGTLLYDGVVASIEKASEAETPARAVVLLSDGIDNTSQAASRESSLEQAGSLRIPVFALGIGQAIDEVYLQDLARESGGRYFIAPSAGEIEGVLNQINELLRSRYLVEMELPDGLEPSGDLQLTVNVQGVPASAAAPLPLVAGTPGAGEDGSAAARTALIVAGIVVGLIVLAGGGYWLWQRREEPSPIPLDENDPSIAVFDAVSARDEPAAPAPRARLLVMEGPQQGAAVDVREQPVTLGSHPDSTLRLQDANGEVAPRHARIWLRQGRFMIHHVAPAGSTRVGERETDWAVLESGDEIGIGPHRILFETGDLDSFPVR